MVTEAMCSGYKTCQALENTTGTGPKCEKLSTSEHAPPHTGMAQSGLQGCSRALACWRDICLLLQMITNRASKPGIPPLRNAS